MAEVGAVFAFLLRGSNTQEVHVGEVGCRVVVGGEPQPAGSEVVAQHLSQTRLVEGDVAGRELGNLAGIDVDAHHIVPEFGHSGGVRRAEIASAENGASHTASIGSPYELTAKRH